MILSCHRSPLRVLLLFLVVPALANAATIEFDPDYAPDPSDLITLPQDGSRRVFHYNVGPYTATDASLVLSYANRDSLFHALGETVEGADLDIRVAPIFNYRIPDVLNPLFEERTIDFRLLQPGGMVDAELRSTGPDALMIGSVTLTLTDDEPPAPTTDLAVASVGPSSLRLTWTAPGDDGLRGRATRYDLRYSTEPVGPDTTAWFEAATEAAGLPDPGPSGTGESYNLTNLEDGTVYYAVLRTEDDFGNLSAYSNVAEGTTSISAAGMALRFDGNNDLVKLPDNLEIISQDFTIEMWVHVNALGDDENIVLIDMRNMAWGNGDNRNAGLYLGIRVHRQPYISFVTTDNYNYNAVLLPEWTVTAGEWGHLAITRGGTTLTGYWNGEPLAWAYNTNPGPIRWRPDYEGTFIGLGWPNHEWGFEGVIDEVRVWDVARSTEEIQEGMNHPFGGSEPGFTGYWKMDDGTGQIVTDDTSQANHGVLGEHDWYENSDPVWVVSDAPIGEGAPLASNRVAFGGSMPIRVGPGPNPFARATSIGYRLAEPSLVTIRLFDVNGRLIRTLIDGQAQGGGFYGAEWRGEDDSGHRVAGGQYYYEVEVGGERRRGKVTILR